MTILLCTPSANTLTGTSKTLEGPLSSGCPALEALLELLVLLVVDVEGLFAPVEDVPVLDAPPEAPPPPRVEAPVVLDPNPPALIPVPDDEDDPVEELPPPLLSAERDVLSVGKMTDIALRS